MELTEVRTRGQDWWSLGFGDGPADLPRSALEHESYSVASQARMAARSGSHEPCPTGVHRVVRW